LLTQTAAQTQIVVIIPAVKRPFMSVEGAVSDATSLKGTTSRLIFAIKKKTAPGGGGGGEKINYNIIRYT